MMIQGILCIKLSSSGHGICDLGACVFTKIDLRLGYHWIRVKYEDILKTSFRIRYGNLT